MSDLICPECDPRDPPHGDSYYAIEQKLVVERDGIVDPDSGAVRRYDHQYSRTVVYAECADCGTVLLDDQE